MASPPTTSRAPSTAPRASRGRRVPRVSGEERERAILQTFERLLEERPLHEISVDDLARGAGISRPTFYFYFASKEAVLLTLMDRLVEQARAGIELSRLAEEPPEVLRRALASIHDTFGDHRAVATAAATARAASAEVRDLWSGVMETFVQETTEVIESERARGAAPPGVAARDLAVALNSMNERVFDASFAKEAPAVAEDSILDTLVEVWLRAIYGTVDPPRAAG
jgi:TetR/AcrR family transcriptional regulator, ethionamide resistance regulator